MTPPARTTIAQHSCGHSHNLRGTRLPIPHFLYWEHRIPTFHDETVKNLLASAVNRGDPRRLNYNKTVFGRGSSPNPGEGNRGYFLPIFSPLVSRPRGASFSSELVPPLFRPKLRPWLWQRNHATSILFRTLLVHKIQEKLVNVTLRLLLIDWLIDCTVHSKLTFCFHS